MNAKKILLVFTLLFLLPMAVYAVDEGPKIKGDYKRLLDRQFKYDGKTVEVVEFMSFYCGSCYAFERSVPVIKGNFPKKVKWRIVPIYWGPASSKPGEAYFLADEAGMGEQMKKALFNANFVEKKDIGSVEVLEALAAKVGLGFDFSRKLRAGAKAAEAEKAMALAKAYNIEETPTLVIAGNIMTSPHAFNHNMETFRDNAVVIIKGIVDK